jgi:hypothetical protein
MAERFQIVIARAEQTKLVPAGRTVERDMNLYPDFALGWEGKGSIWLRRGTMKDVEKAKVFATKEGYTVFVFPTGEREALEKAKTAVVEAKS